MIVLDFIKDELSSASIIDTHEHLSSAELIKETKRDIFSFLAEAYLRDDLMSVGMSGQLLFKDLESHEKWKRISPFLERVQNTTYYRSLIDAFNALFHLSITDISDDTWCELNDHLVRASQKGKEWYNYVLKHEGHIENCFLDRDRTTNYELEMWGEKGFKSRLDKNIDLSLFTPVKRTDLILNVYHPMAREEIERTYQIDLSSFNNIRKLVEAYTKEALLEKSVAFKSVAAYFREIHFPKVSLKQSELSYKNILRGNGSDKDIKVIQNYIIHLFLEQAEEYQIPIQFHTGMQALNENIVNNSNPLLLTNLFLEYPKVSFILLHGGYPFHASAGVLAKKFTNVFLDFTWLPQICFAGAKHALQEWLDLVPMTKITWGGDCRQVEDTYATILLLRKVLGEVLTEKFKNGNFHKPLVKKIINNILHDNAVRIYKLNQ